MIARGLRPRSGITLTEILIAILIMGVGLISLATLFPLGLIRLREATRSSRAGLTYETAADDMDTRALFFKPSFTQTWYWYPGANNSRVPRDPFVQDALPDGTFAGIIASNPGSTNGQFPNGNALLSNGLPFCYDPLWRSLTGVVPNALGLADPTLDFQPAYANAANEARFGAGLFSNGTVPYLRADPDGGTPSAHGLQRLTNFIPWSNNGLTPQYPFSNMNASLSAANQPIDVAGTVFASNDDIVFNPFGGKANPFSLGDTVNPPSSLVPDMTYPSPTAASPQADYRFTWFVTGRQADAGGNGMQFVGEVVVSDNRPFGFDPLPGQSVNAPAGEAVMEAVFGYGANFPPPVGTVGFSTSTKTVLLRWPLSMPDPQVRVGGWICDVTYERNVNLYQSRAGTTGTTFARCYWYQIGKRTDPQSDVLVPDPTYRSMVLTLTSPLRAQTLLNTSTGLPVHLNVALSMPSVINVYPRAFEVH